MRKRKSFLLPLVAVVSLLSIGGVIATGMLKKNPLTNLKKPAQIVGVLGETTQLLETPTPALIDRLIKETVENTKNVVSQKTQEVEKTILNTVEHEAANLTQSQLDALKLQICRDLGVVSPAPTKQP